MTLRAAALLALLALFPASISAEIDQRVDSTVFSIHVDTASQLDLNELEQHLENARGLFHSSQKASVRRW